MVSEHDEQVGFVNWFRGRFPGVLIYAIPNGEQRAKTTGKRLKAEGVVAGMPDLHIPQWGLWVEMKRTDGGSVSAVQKCIHKQLEAIGQTVIIGWGAREASRLVLEWVRSANPPP